MTSLSLLSFTLHCPLVQTLLSQKTTQEFILALDFIYQSINVPI